MNFRFPCWEFIINAMVSSMHFPGLGDSVLGMDDVYKQSSTSIFIPCLFHFCICNLTQGTHGCFLLMDFPQLNGETTPPFRSSGIEEKSAADWPVPVPSERFIWWNEFP